MSDQEYNEEKLRQIRALIVVKDSPQYFPRPIIIKTTPHTEIARIYGVVVTKDNKVVLMNNEEQWNEITATDKNADVVIQSLFQRLKGIELTQVAE